MAWRRREPKEIVRVIGPSPPRETADPGRDRSFSSCFVRAMILMLGMPALGGGAAAGLGLVMLHVGAIPSWLATSLFLGGLAGGFALGMRLVIGMWGQRLSAAERTADLVIREDRSRGGAFAMMSHTAVLAIVIGAIALGTGQVDSLGVVAATCALCALMLVPATLLGVRVAGDEMVIRGIAPPVRRIERAEILDINVRQRYRGWESSLYVETRDEHLTRIPLPVRGPRGSEVDSPPWAEPLREWWQRVDPWPSGSTAGGHL